jgi:putative transcriptional regulator
MNTGSLCDKNRRQDNFSRRPFLMTIVVTLDVMLARRKMRSKELAEHIGITEQNLSLLKSGKVKGVRFDTLARICEVLECQPGDLLMFDATEQKRTVT